MNHNNYTLSQNNDPSFIDQQHSQKECKYRNYDINLECQQELGDNIKIGIDRNEVRSSTFMNYVVYHIYGQDKNGVIDVFRRFNEFYKMRVAMVKRFPGCFIPSIPEKSISLIDDQIVNKRQRYLNDFVRRITKMPHLYNSQEFQALLRSAEKDLSGTFERWPNPTSNDIILKYKQKFSHLSGKIIDSTVKASILDFTKLLERTNIYMYKYKILIKSLATQRDKFDKALGPFFTRFLPSFERQVISQCTNKPEQLFFTFEGEKIAIQQKILSQTLVKNPYWILYDLIKREERDSLAFLQNTKAISEYEKKRYDLQVKLANNDKAIAQISMGKKSNSEMKFKLEVENQSLKKQKENVQCLQDIITALIAFWEMEKFKRQKSFFYLNVLKKIGNYQRIQTDDLISVWSQWKEKTQRALLCFNK